jgi:hypothetical protein
LSCDSAANAGAVLRVIGVRPIAWIDAVTRSSDRVSDSAGATAAVSREAIPSNPAAAFETRCNRPCNSSTRRTTPSKAVSSPEESPSIRTVNVSLKFMVPSGEMTNAQRPNDYFARIPNTPHHSTH